MRFNVGDIVRMAKDNEALETDEFGKLKNIEGRVHCIDDHHPETPEDNIRVKWDDLYEYNYWHQEKELRLVRRWI